MNGRIIQDKYMFGISKEFEFLANMDVNYQFQLDNLNNTNKYSIVDFRIPNTNIYIELRSRTCRSNSCSTTFFDKSKVDRWNSNKHYKNAILYIAFAFTDDKYYFIMHKKSKFKNIKTVFKPEWNQTNFDIPLNKCISTDKFNKKLTN